MIHTSQLIKTLKDTNYSLVEQGHFTNRDDKINIIVTNDNVKIISDNEIEDTTLSIEKNDMKDVLSGIKKHIENKIDFSKLRRL